MPKKSNPKRKKAKPGPEEERLAILAIKGNPQDVIAKLLRKPTKQD